MMLTSSLFGSPIVLPQKSSAAPLSHTRANPVVIGTGSNNNGCGSGGLVIECSSRPQKKATSHHRKTRPRKTQPWDIKRKPTVYPPLPPLPPEWTLVSSAAQDIDVEAAPPPSSTPALDD